MSASVRTKKHIPSVTVPGAFAVIGFVYAWIAFGYGLGSWHKPGPGAVPFIIGGAIALTGLVVVYREYARYDDSLDDPSSVVDGRAEDVGESEVPISNSRLSMIPTLIAAAAICALMIWQPRIIGLLPAVSLGVALTAYLMRTSIAGSMALGLGFFGCAYLVFEGWLNLPLPTGYF